MAGRPLGRKNIRAYMASSELERLNINPIEGALQSIKELDDIIKLNVDAFKMMRGYTDDSDQGSAYLANAIRAVTAKKDTYLALARFKYPTLTAVAIKDFSENESELKPVNTEEAIKIINSDPFRDTTKKVIDSMTEVRNINILPKGNKDEG